MYESTVLGRVPPPWDWSTLLERLFWGPVSGVAVLPLYFLVEQLQVGERVELYALAGMCVLAWSGGEGMCRRSWRAALWTAAVGVPAALVLYTPLQFISGHVGLAFAAAAVGAAAGMGYTTKRGDRSTQLGFITGVSAFVAGALFLGAVWLIGGASSYLFGALMLPLGGAVNLGAGLALLVGRKRMRRMPARRWQFGLLSMVVFVLLCGVELGVALNFFEILPPSAHDMVAFHKLGEEAQASLKARKPGEKVEAKVFILVLRACRYHLALPEVEKHLGPAEARSFDGDLSYAEGNRSRNREGTFKGWSFDEAPAGAARPGADRIGVETGDGARIENVFIHARNFKAFASYRDSRSREFSFFFFTLTALLPVNMGVVSLIEWRRRRRLMRMDNIFGEA
ncbi:MAG: hypothetical protein L6R28_23450 [Planctomycetes bacterium]|nr:hypothetical protein [Planctomycetota bacterium]